jgi:hypothetical protein
MSIKPTTIKSGDLPEFLKNNKSLFEHTNFPPSYINEILTKIWDYGNTQWEKGYKQGKYDPDFLNEQD